MANNGFWETIGFNLLKKPIPDQTPSITMGEKDDGAVTMLGRLGGAYGYSLDLDAGLTGSTESDLIQKYREIAEVPEIDTAIEDIVNEFISTDANEQVSIDLDNVKGIGAQTKKAIYDEFDHILKLLNFSNRSFEIVRCYYIDGRLNYHLVIDSDPEVQKKEGIKELKYIDPRKIRKIRLVDYTKSESGVVLQSVTDEYYLFSESGFDQRAPLNTPGLSAGQQHVKLAKDSVVQVVSGLMDPSRTVVWSYLHKAIRPLNQLRSLEDASIIYRLSRAPERRIFYVDVGNLPNGKVEQYLQSVMAQHKSKLVYDVKSGKINNDPRHLTMLEDYWMPRRDGGKSTEVVTLPGGQNLGEMTEVNYFLQKLYKALNIPSTRLDPSNGMLLGRQVEVSRDEVKFAKFIARLRRRFGEMLLDLLERQLIVKQVMRYDEWEKIRSDISFEFAADNIFSEIKENEIMEGRLNLLDRIMNGAGAQFYSHEYVSRNILRLTKEEMVDLKKQRDVESAEMAATNPERQDLINTNFEQQVRPTAAKPTT